MKTSIPIYEDDMYEDIIAFNPVIQIFIDSASYVLMCYILLTFCNRIMNQCDFLHWLKLHYKYKVSFSFANQYIAVQLTVK